MQFIHRVNTPLHLEKCPLPLKSSFYSVGEGNPQSSHCYIMKLNRRYKLANSEMVFISNSCACMTTTVDSISLLHTGPANITPLAQAPQQQARQMRTCRYFVMTCRNSRMLDVSQAKSIWGTNPHTAARLNTALQVNIVFFIS